MKYEEYLMHFNPNHDKLGRFSKSSGGAGAYNTSSTSNAEKESASSNKDKAMKILKKTVRIAEGATLVARGLIAIGAAVATYSVVKNTMFSSIPSSPLNIGQDAMNRALKHDIVKDIVASKADSWGKSFGDMTMADLTKMDLY